MMPVRRRTVPPRPNRASRKYRTNPISPVPPPVLVGGIPGPGPAKPRRAKRTHLRSSPVFSTNTERTQSQWGGPPGLPSFHCPAQMHRTNPIHAGFPLAPGCAAPRRAKRTHLRSSPVFSTNTKRTQSQWGGPGCPRLLRARLPSSTVRRKCTERTQSTPAFFLPPDAPHRAAPNEPICGLPLCFQQTPNEPNPRWCGGCPR
jgi:hypothetical protein